MYPRGHLAHLFERDLDAAPKQLSMGCHHREKRLNENLAPLRRFLQRHVGRPWDHVRSEIAAHVRRTSAVQAHIFQHLDDFVLTDVVVVDGIPHDRRWGTLSALWRHGAHAPLWVCPRTGILRAPRARPKVTSRYARRLRPSTSVELLEIDGVWRHITLRPFRNVPRDTIVDALAGPLDSASFTMERYQRTYRRNDAYASEVLPLGLREIALVRAKFGRSTRVA